MKNHHLLRRVSLGALVVFLYIISACNSPSTTTQPINTVGPIPSSTSAVVESYPSTTVTSAPIKTLLPVSTSTLVPTAIPPSNTPTPTQTWTPTPLPTIPSDTVVAFVQELIRSNAGCQLPCWWGSMPGQTTWKSVEPFLATFAEVEKINDTYSASVYAPDKVNPTHVYGASYVVQDGIIQSIQTGPGPGEEGFQYLLPQFLTTYGVPDEVWISTFSSTATSVIPFRLTLIYTKGIVVSYWLENVQIQDDFVLGCFQQPYRILFWLVSPERGIAFSQARVESTQFSENQPYLSLEEATGLSIENFYETFMNPNNTACLETPSNFWP